MIQDCTTRKEGVKKTKLKKILLKEDGTTLEYLIRVAIIGLGSATVLFGILIALRLQGGKIIEGISNMGF